MSIPYFVCYYVAMGGFMESAKESLADRYNYKTRFFNDANELKEKIINKTVIPHQVEVQPGRMSGALCWLRCPYCYGKTAIDTGERLPRERYIEILRQIAEGGVNKIAFAGYATDPLNYEYIEDLLQVVRDNNQIFGVHTKLLRLSERFISQVTSSSIEPQSFLSVSVDAGTNETYNIVHGEKTSKAKIYDKVCSNIRRITKARSISGAPLDISTTYLINSWNNQTEEVLKAINDLRNAGSNLIRFTFIQVPRGYQKKDKDENVPSREEVLEYMERLAPIVHNEDGDDCRVLIMDLDSDYETYNVHRSLPCYARFIYPTIGFDGWLYHCSESASPHFRELAIGNLNERDFWDLFYDYDVKDFRRTIKQAGELMDRTRCKCDRKEHVVNSTIRESAVFDGVC
jgi:MoaA/NifB/PqqE/SkfB family radical SAM enzyme